MSSVAVDVETAAVPDQPGQEGGEGEQVPVLQHSEVRHGAVQEGHRRRGGKSEREKLLGAEVYCPKKR